MGDESGESMDSAPLKLRPYGAIIIIIIMEPVGEVSLVGLVESEFKFELSRYDNPNVRLRQTDRQTDSVIVRTEAAMSK